MDSSEVTDVQKANIQCEGSERRMMAIRHHRKRCQNAKKSSGEVIAAETPQIGPGERWRIVDGGESPQALRVFSSDVFSLLMLVGTIARNMSMSCMRGELPLPDLTPS